MEYSKTKAISRLKKLSIILGILLVGMISLVYLLGLFYLISPSKACPSDQIQGKSNQEIADVLGYPLLTLSQLPPDLPKEFHVVALTDFPDPRCFLYIRYGSTTQQKHPVEIMVVISPDQERREEENWKCLDDPTLNFVTTCSKTIMYKGNLLRVWMGTQYSFAETQALTEFVETAA